MARPRLGQHFLTDPGILQRIVDALDPSERDVVLEIGAGKGSLTRELARRVGRVVAIEKDPSLAADLAQSLQSAGEELVGRVTVIRGDALELDWHRLADAAGAGGSFKVAGNIPYYVTSPLLEKALLPPLPEVLVFLVQREVADRLRAEPGSKAYGALSVGVRVLARVERLFRVKAGAFRPRPKVDSAVVRLVPRKDPLVGLSEHEEFRSFVTALFTQRRKQLARGLRTLTEVEGEKVERWLAEAQVDPRRRVETLSPEELVALFRRLPWLTLETEGP